MSETKKKLNLKDYKEPIDLTDYDLTAKEAICAFCYQCCAYQAGEVKQCNLTTCPLFRYKEKWFKIPHKKHDITEKMLDNYKRNNNKQ